MLPKLLLATTALFVLLGVACSDDDSETTSSNVCDARDALVQSIQDLATINVISEGRDGVESALDDVRSNADDLRDAVSEDAKGEVDDLESAITDAQDILSNLNTDDGLSGVVDDIQTAFTGISDAATALTNELSNECP